MVRLQDILVRDYYTPNTPNLSPSATIRDALEIFLQHNLDVVCIVDASHHFVGIVSKYSVYRLLLQNATLDSPIEPLILRNVITVNVEDSLENAKDILLAKQVGHGVVVNDEGRALGIMGKADMIQGFLMGTEVLVSQLEGLIEHLQDAVISVDSHNFVTTFNHAAELVLRLPKHAVIGKPISAYFPELEEPLTVALHGRHTVGPLRIKLGSAVVHASFISITLDDDKPDGNYPGVPKKSSPSAMAVLHDITSLEVIAKELETTKNLEHTLQSAIAMSYDGIMIMDTEGHLTVANDTFVEIFHLNRTEIIGKHWSVVVPELYLQQEWEGEFSKGKICFIENQSCFVTQEPIVRSGKRLGTIVKIILRQLGQWRDVFRHLEGLERELHFYRGEVRRMSAQSNAFDRIITVDENMKKMKEQALLASRGVSTVLITGESGTGKELFADAIHEESGRKGNFVKVNCAAVPTELLESEFFGYAEGAFTGAKRGGKPGKFELADNGTLFLDEIGDMPLQLQSKLLRVLQEQQFERLGDTKSQHVNVRIIAATNRDLKQLIHEGSFREDLYYRIHVVHLSVPPLRNRPHDITILCNHLLQKLNQKMNKHIIGMTPEVVSAFQQYNWPGNVRQLENVIERAMNFDIRDWIELRHLPEEVRVVTHQNDYTHPKTPAFPFQETQRQEPHERNLQWDKYQEETDRDTFTSHDSSGAMGNGYAKGGTRSEFENPQNHPIPSFQTSMEQWEKKCLLDALNKTNGNRTKAAEILGVSRSTLYQKIRRYHIKNETRFKSN